MNKEHIKNQICDANIVFAQIKQLYKPKYLSFACFNNVDAKLRESLSILIDDLPNNKDDYKIYLKISSLKGWSNSCDILMLDLMEYSISYKYEVNITKNKNIDCRKMSIIMKFYGKKLMILNIYLGILDQLAS